MATSELGYYVRHTESALDALDPCDTGMLRRALGNLNHIADQYAQRRIGWVIPVGGSPFVTVSGEPTAGKYYRLYTSTPFDLHVAADGASYPCRVRLRIKSGHANIKATFRACLSPVGRGATEVNVADVNVAEMDVTGTAYAWTRAENLIWLDALRVREARTTVSTIDSIGGAPVGALWLRAELSVWVSVQDTELIAGLGGVELDEYVPPEA